MKIFVLPTWHPTSFKPLWANWVIPHIDLLREAGHEVSILQLGFDGAPIENGRDRWNQEVQYIGSRHLYLGTPAPTKFQRNRFLYGVWLRRYGRLMENLFSAAVSNWGLPDVLHAHVSLPGGYLAAEIGDKFNLPVIVQEHYSGFKSDARFPWRVGSYAKLMNKRSQGFYAVSRGFADTILETNLVDVTGVLPNPIDTDLFFPDHVVRKSDHYRIVTVGNIGKIKGSDILFKALSKLPREINWRLYHVGDCTHVEKYIKDTGDVSLNKRITCLGKLPQTELAKVFSKSDLYVVSSRRETANTSMLQAMSCGVPVVTTRCGGPETLLQESVSVLVENENPDDLARGITFAIRNRNKFDPTVMRNFVIDHYSKPVVLKLVEKAYEEAITKKRIERGACDY